MKRRMHYPHLCCQFKDMSKGKICQIDIIAFKVRDNRHDSRNCSQDVTMCHHYSLYKLEIGERLIMWLD